MTLQAVITTTIPTLFSLLATSVSAFNDWTKPCHQGECYYDIPANVKSMAATLKITGTPSAISDITNAAGWEVLDCSTDDLMQNVRLVCLDNDSICSHIFQDGAEHTVVRLPEHCGRGPFARISRASVSEDQSIPAHVRARMKKRRGRWPSVLALSLDTDFSQATVSNKGNVSITVYGSTIPGISGAAMLTSLQRRHARDMHHRGERKSVPEEFDIFSAFSPSNSDLGPFIRNTTEDSIPINVDQQFNVFNSSLPCSGNNVAKLSIDADVNLRGQIDLGVIAQGTIIPPKFDQFGLFATMSADLLGKLSISSDISGELDSPQITFVNVGLPGLTIPDIISLGPSISLAAKATASINAKLNMDMGIGYNINNLMFFFPPSQSHSSSASVIPKDAPLELSVTPGVQSSTSFSAHLIPSLNLGLVAFDVSTAAFLDFDTSATLTLDLNAGFNGSIDTTGATSTSAQTDGCVNVKGGISVNVGLEVNLPLFDVLGDSATINLAEKEFDFFNQCFPNTTNSPSATVTTFLPTDSPSTGPPSSTSPVTGIEPASDSLRISNKSGFSCLPNSEMAESTVVNKTLSIVSFQDN